MKKGVGGTFLGKGQVGVSLELVIGVLIKGGIMNLKNNILWEPISNI